MADTPVPQSPLSASNSKVSSREYLEQLRARRTQRNVEPSQQAAEQPQPPAVEQTEPVAPPIDPQAALPEQPVEQPLQEEPQPQQPENFENQAYQQPAATATESEVFPGQYKPVPEETVYEWQAASRPFKKRNRQFYTTVGLITMLISLILFFAGQFLPIAVVIAVAFLGYVLSSVPPEIIKNKITTYGIRNDDTLFYWDDLGRFWFETRYDQIMVVIETAQFPGRITLLIATEAQKDVEELLSEVLLKQKPAETFFDKATDWLQKNIPLDS